ncbi:acetate kinase [uncultured Albimonas sp.]|uniref:acetate/propionate family kinase n=1 Tax=uncultured Albimonas sp. TaxID=1331701 RepID=UPI0030EEF74C|tara:strand:+ start:1243 stop:2301 length:1059 start_codon:yes stop_codon:yes gene_type:complete
MTVPPARDWILTLNAGSSSLKLALHDLEGAEIAAGQMSDLDVMTVSSARLGETTRALAEGRGLAAAPLAVGHRVAHGVEFRAPGELTPAMRAALEKACAFAPLHNPPALHVIDAAAELFPQARRTACFDTAFHATQPPEETTFPIPEAWRAAGLRRYGFHGLSYASMVRRLPAQLGGPLPPRLLACHLGAGSSMAAIREGVSVATTMGFSPMEGLVMATRCGELDPGVIFHLLRAGETPESLERALNRDSGLKALGGSGSMKDLLARDDPAARFAVAHYCHWAIRHAGSLIAGMGGVDAICFTGGIGEHAAPVREAILDGLRWAGLDEGACHVIVADEAGEIAHATLAILRG